MHNPLQHDEKDAPAPETASRFYVSGGTLRRDAPSYVYRQADTDLYDALQNGDLCYILTARQMGKSSLMVRTVVRLREEGAAAVVLDLTLQGRHLSMEQWYDGLFRQVGRHCGLEDEFEAWRIANRSLSPLQRLIAGLREVALRRLTGKLFVFIDEIDAVRSLSFATDEFFAALRALHNSRVEDPDMERLTFCLLGVASPADLVRDTRITPFNVSRRIELTDFTVEEARVLEEGLRRPRASLSSSGQDSQILDRILYWTGGHPYLSQRLCALVAASPSPSGTAGVDSLCANAFFTPQAHDQEDNLLFVRERLLRSEVDRTDLLSLYARIVSGKRVADNPADPLVSVLRLSGVTRTENGALRVRNRIYQRVFDRAWIASNLPDAELKRQKIAYQRGQLRASFVAAAIIAVLAMLGAGAKFQADRAERGERNALIATRRAEASAREAEANADRAEANADRANQLARQEAAALKTAAVERDRARHERNTAIVARKQAIESAKREHEAKQHALAAARSEARARQIAVAETRVATAQTLTARRHAYVAGIVLAWQNLNRHVADSAAILPGVRDLLDGMLPGTGQPELRGFEWRYLEKLVHRNVISVPAHKGRIWAVAFSPDDRFLASAGDDGAVRLWDGASLKPIATFRAGSDRVLGATFSPDGKMLATCGGDHAVTLWDLQSRSRMMTLTGHTEDVNQVAFSPDGGQLASASDDKTVRLWNPHSGALVAVLKGYSDWATGVSYAPDGKMLAIGCADGTVHVWNRVRGAEAFSYSAHIGPVTAVTFGSDSKGLITAGRDYFAKRWILGVAEAWGSPPLAGHLDQITALAMSGGTALTVSPDSVARLWCRDSSNCIGELRGYTSNLHAGALSRSARIAGLGDDQGRLYLWDLKSSHEDPAFPATARHDIFADARFVRDRRLLAVTINPDAPAAEHAVCVRDMGSDLPLARVPASICDGSTATISADGTLVAFTEDEHIPVLWNVRSGRVVHLPNPSRDYVRCTAFSPDGKWIAAGCDNGSILFYDTAAGTLSASQKCGSARIVHIAFSSNGRMAASIAYDGRVRIMDLADRRSCRVFSGVPQIGRECVFSPDCRFLAASGVGSTIDLWEVQTGQHKTIQTGHNAPICGVAFSPDGKTIASTGAEGLVRLWSIPTLQEVAALTLTAPYPVFATSAFFPNIPMGICVFSADSRRLAAFTANFGRVYDTRPINDFRP